MKKLLLLTGTILLSLSSCSNDIECPKLIDIKETVRYQSGGSGTQVPVGSTYYYKFDNGEVIKTHSPLHLYINQVYCH